MARNRSGRYGGRSQPASNLKKRDYSYYNYISSGQHAYAQAQPEPDYDDWEYEQPKRRPAAKPGKRPSPGRKPPQKRPNPGQKQKKSAANANAANIRKRYKARKKLRSASYTIDIPKEKKGYFLLSLTLFIIFAGAFMCVFSVAYVGQIEMYLTREQELLKDLSVQNIAIKGEILDSYDLAEYQRYATEELGMVRPVDSQIVYIEPQNVSYFEQFDPKTEEITPSSIFDSLWGFLSDIMKETFGSLIKTEQPVVSGEGTS